MTRFFHRRIGTDGYGRFFIYRGGSVLSVRPHRYALARTLATPLGADEFGCTSATCRCV
jgi:hypothetical protein